MLAKGFDLASSTYSSDKSFGSYSTVFNPWANRPVASVPSTAGTLPSAQYGTQLRAPAFNADQILSSCIVDSPRGNHEFGVREGLALTFGAGSIISAIIGACTGHLTSLGILAVTLAGAGSASLMLDSESSIKLETNNGYTLQLDRRI